MIFGFLGSGKTTLLRHLLGARARGLERAGLAARFAFAGVAPDGGTR